MTLIELLQDFPEINPANYGDDDVNALNAWGIAAHKAIEALQAENESSKRQHHLLIDDFRNMQEQRDALAAKLVPLTQEQVVEGFCKTPHQVQYVAVFDAGVRFAEAAHGIQAKGGQHEDA
jgi:hypothetical protein